jgi:hypothetical protein
MQDATLVMTHHFTIVQGLVSVSVRNWNLEQWDTMLMLLLNIVGLIAQTHPFAPRCHAYVNHNPSIMILSEAH